MQASLTVRAATAADLPEIERCVAAAYAMYVERIGWPPAPMTADYEALVGRGLARVAEDERGLAGLVVAWRQADHLFIENVAVWPERQGEGIGSRLLEGCEAQARELGLGELRLYTNEAMTENLAYYPRRGFVAVGRRVEDGFRRVYFTKRLDG